MARFDTYPPGVPCFVDTITPDPAAARRFYGGVLGWEFAGPGPMPGNPPGEYWIARAGGLDVAGVGRFGGGVPSPPAAWTTYVSVPSVADAAAAARSAGGVVIQEPADAAPAGRLAVVADPTGATFGLWQAGERHGAQVVNVPSAWAMSMLITTDPDAAAAFYERLFGWRAEQLHPGMSLFRLPGYVGGEPEQPVPRDVVAATARADGDDPTPPHWDVDFWIADADAAATHAFELGGHVVAPPHDEPPFRRAVLAAPDGARFSVSELRLSAPDAGASPTP